MTRLYQKETAAENFLGLIELVDLVFVFHCFDRIVIQGYLPVIDPSRTLVHFFRDVHGLYPITPQVLAKPTSEYRGWVGGYARNHKIPVMKTEKGVSQEDCPALPATDGTAESTGGLRHFHQHGNGQHVPLTNAQVSHR